MIKVVFVTGWVGSWGIGYDDTEKKEHVNIAGKQYVTVQATQTNF